MRKIGIGVGGSLWFLLVFWAVYRLTFPSQTIADRVAWEVQERSNYALSMEGAHPWWVGLGGSEVTLSSVDRRSGAATPMITADAVRARISPFGLLGGAARVTGDVTLGEGGIDFYVDAQQGERGTDIKAVDVSATGFPISALPPMGGFSIEGTGGVDLSIELDAADGFNKADGHLRVGGQEIVVSSIPEADVLLKSFNVLPMIIEEIDIDVPFVSGKGRVEAGRIATSLANIEIGGQITLMKRIERSKCDLTIEIQPTPDMPAQVLSLLASAKNGDAYKYKISGVCTRASPTPASARRPARPRRPRPQPAAPRAGADPTAAAGGAPSPRGRAVPPTADLARPRATAIGRRGEPAADEVEELDELDEEELLEEELDEEGELLEPGEEIVPNDY